MFPITLEVKQPQGSLKTGIKNGKPWAIAEQEAAVLIAGADYPVVGLVNARTENVRVQDNQVLCDVRWLTPGRYQSKVVIETDRFRRISARIIDRDLKPVVAEAPKARAA